MRRLRARQLHASDTRPSRGGFTLLEVLVTAILSATLLAGLWSLFGTYLRLFESGQARVERSQLVRALARQFSDDIHGVVATVPQQLGASGPSPLAGNASMTDSTGATTSNFESRPTASATLLDATEEKNVPTFSLVGNGRMLRLEVLQPASSLDLVGSSESPSSKRTGETSNSSFGTTRPRATALRTIVYRFQPPRDVAESDREPPPGLLRRELSWEEMNATALHGGLGSSSQSAEEAEFERGFTPLTALDVEEASQSDDSVIWTPEVVAFRFRYFDGRSWFDEWDSRTRRSLPAAVDIAMRFDSSTIPGQMPRHDQVVQPVETSPTGDDPLTRPTDVEDGEISDEELEAQSPSSGSRETDQSRAPLVRQLVLLQSPAAARGADSRSTDEPFPAATSRQVSR